MFEFNSLRRISAAGLSESQKRTLGKRKLKGASRTLKRKLSTSLGVDVPTPGASPAKRQRAEADDLLKRWGPIMLMHPCVCARALVSVYFVFFGGRKGTGA